MSRQLNVSDQLDLERDLPAPRDSSAQTEGGEATNSNSQEVERPAATETLEDILNDREGDETYIPCRFCGERVSRSEFAHHRRNECKNRVQKPCENCLFTFPEFENPLAFFENNVIFPESNAAKAMAPVSKREQILYKEYLDAAKLLEFKSWVDLEVISILDTVPRDANIVDTRWIETWKLNNSGSIKCPKMRLVLKGYQDRDRFELRIDSPTASILSIRILFQVAVNQDWKIGCVDLKVAFLQGDFYDKKENRDVYSPMPLDLQNLLGIPGPQKFLKLQKAAYGLNDAPRRFFVRLRNKLLEYGFRQSLTDKCVFFSKNGENLNGVICTHVDDIIWTGTSKFHDDFVSKLTNDFSYGKLVHDSFSYCGMTVERTRKSVVLHQHHYVDSLKTIEQGNDTDFTTVLTPERESQFRGVIGNLGWISTRSRPDGAFGANATAIKNSNGEYTEDHIRNVNKHVKFLRKTRDLTLNFVPQLIDPKIVVYSDAAFANNSDKSSQSGYLIFVVSGPLRNLKSVSPRLA